MQRHDDDSHSTCSEGRAFERLNEDFCCLCARAFTSAPFQPRYERTSRICCACQAKSKLGLKWKEILYRPATGTEIRNDALAIGLQKSLCFEKGELESFRIPNLHEDSWTKVGDKYFQIDANDWIEEDDSDYDDEDHDELQRLYTEMSVYLNVDDQLAWTQADDDNDQEEVDQKKNGQGP